MISAALRRAGATATVAALGLLAVALVPGLAPSASAAERTVAVKGGRAPGPEQYDRVFVTKFGPRKAKRVLVLVPGTNGAAGNLTLIARDLVERVPKFQVWALDRRSRALEDTSMFEQVLRGEATPDDALDYYLGWIADPSIQPRYQPLADADFPFVRGWGLKVAIRDLRKVVRKAGKRGRKVILGGHSLGASTALAYSTWDFGGRPGYRHIDGLVLIDGGLLGSFSDSNLEDVQRALAELEQGSPFRDLLGIGLPWAAGAFVEAGALYAKADPTGFSAMQQFPLLPPQFNPPVPVTNRALLGYALDADSSPPELALIHVRSGRLADSGTPRDWQDGEVTPVARLTESFAQEPNGVEWYYPARLNIDVDGADSLRRNKVTRFLGLRTWHMRKVKLPLYAIQTSLTPGTILRGARRFIKRSRVRRKRAVLVDASATHSHLDPLLAAPGSNEFLRTAVPFLRRVGR